MTARHYRKCIKPFGRKTPCGPKLHQNHRDNSGNATSFYIPSCKWSQEEKRFDSNDLAISSVLIIRLFPSHSTSNVHIHFHNLVDKIFTSAIFTRLLSYMDRTVACPSNTLDKASLTVKDIAPRVPCLIFNGPS